MSIETVKPLSACGRITCVEDVNSSLLRDMVGKTWAEAILPHCNYDDESKWDLSEDHLHRIDERLKELADFSAVTITSLSALETYRAPRALMDEPYEEYSFLREITHVKELYPYAVLIKSTSPNGHDKVRIHLTNLGTVAFWVAIDFSIPKTSGFIEGAVVSGHAKDTENAVFDTVTRVSPIYYRPHVIKDPHTIRTIFDTSVIPMALMVPRADVMLPRGHGWYLSVFRMLPILKTNKKQRFPDSELFYDAELRTVTVKVKDDDLHYFHVNMVIDLDRLVIKEPNPREIVVVKEKIGSKEEEEEDSDEEEESEEESEDEDESDEESEEDSEEEDEKEEAEQEDEEEEPPQSGKRKRDDDGARDGQGEKKIKM
jgi:hypothetical protein